jgi:stringent starvation protein B
VAARSLPAVVSTKPYLLRAIYQWCLDQGLTPYLSVVVGAGAHVPRQFVKDGQIVLNIGSEATQHLLLGDDEITFQARFSGAVFPVVVPVGAVAAIYARENGQGMAFEVAAAGTTDGPQAPAEPSAGPADRDLPPRRPTLTRVK